MSRERLGVTRVRGLAVLAQNVRAAVERGDKEDALKALAELIFAALDIKVVVKADQLDEPGDFTVVIASARARSVVEAPISTGATRPLHERGYGFDTGGLGQPDPDCSCPACVRHFAARSVVGE